MLIAKLNFPLRFIKRMHVNEVKNYKLGRSRISNSGLLSIAIVICSKPPINMSNYLFVAGETGFDPEINVKFQGKS